MSANEDLRHVWWRADYAEPVFGAHEVRRWPAGQLDRLRQSGLLRETEMDTGVMCYDCSRQHGAEVFYPNEDLFGRTRPHIMCPEEGLIEVSFDDMRRWQVDRQALVRMIAAALETAGHIEQVVPDRVWSLGRRRLGGRFRDFFFVVGVVRPDGPAVIASAGRIASAPSPVILASGLPPRTEQSRNPALPVFYLSQITGLGDGRLILDLAYIEDALPRDPATFPAASAGQAATAELGTANVFRREQDVWALSFYGKTIRLKHLAGLGYIAELLRAPGREIEALALVGQPSNGQAPVPSASGIGIADEQAVRAVRAALQERERELGGVAENDWSRRGSLREEISKLRQYLQQAQGFGGRGRKSAGAAEKARKAVSAAVTRALAEIEEHHPSLAAHLRSSVELGATLLYRPPNDLDWEF